MKENPEYEQWKENLEHRASEVHEAPEPSPEEIDRVVRGAAVDMGDKKSLDVSSRPIETIIQDMEAEGWHYRGPAMAGTGVYEAVAEDNKEIRIIGTGTGRFVFEREEGLDT